MSIEFHLSFLELEKSPISKLNDFLSSKAFADYKKKIEQDQENEAKKLNAVQKTIANCASGIMSAVGDVARVMARK